MERVARTLSLLSLLLLPALLQAQEPKIQNWSAPPYWAGESRSDEAGERSLKAGKVSSGTDAVAIPAVPFVAMSPCRLADTRGNGYTGPYGPPFLTPAVARDFPVVGQCGIPSNAQAVSFNFTVVRTQGLGLVVAWPDGSTKPGTSTVNYVAGQIVANSSVVQLGGGAITVEASGAQTDLLIDINGYYAGKIVSTLNSLSGDLILAAGSNLTITPSGSTLTLSASSVPGPQGVPGAQGTQGIQGGTGADGAQGAQGEIGADGADGTSITFRGAWNDSTSYDVNDAVSYLGSSYAAILANGGAQPDINPVHWMLLAQAGADGQDGAAGSQGIQGNQGNQGDPGAAGTTGATGAQGIQGTTGANGTQGTQGDPGATGTTGATGAQGTQGSAGADGAQGAQGEIGNDGADGADGTSITFRGAWSDSISYDVNDAVSYLGSSYAAILANGGAQPDINPVFWMLLAQAGANGADGATGPQGPQGPQGGTGAQGIQGNDGATGAAGADGQGMLFQGEWAPVTTYAFNDAVSFQGSSYVSEVEDNLGHSPDVSPNEWSMIARAGDDGIDGATGPTGPAGSNGSNGTNGIDGVDGLRGAYQSSHMLNGTTGTVYLSPIMSVPTAPSAIELPERLAFTSVPCTMNRISVFVTSSLGAAVSETYTLRVGANYDEILLINDLVNTSLSCTVPSLGQRCTFDGAVPVDAGALFDVRLDIIGTAPGLHHAIVALTCE